MYRTTLLSTALFATSLVAQSAPVVLTSAQRHEITADGASHRTRFTRAGAHFAPRRDAQLHGEAETGFRAIAATLAGAALPVSEAEPSATPTRVAYERGSFVEYYELRADGIEQCFRFDALPSRGELALRIDVASALVAEQGDGGFVFRGPRSAVRYGAAQAFDARGRHAKLTTELCEGDLVITVPASFVAEAELPLLVDPLIAVASPVAASTEALGNPDLAWDESAQMFALVWEHQTSASNWDLRLATLRLDGSLVGNVRSLENGVQRWRKPRIANLGNLGRFQVVAEVSEFGGIETWIGGVRFDLRADGTVNTYPAVTLARAGLHGNPATGSFANPDLGGDGNPLVPGHWMLVYEHEQNGTRDVLMRMLHRDGGFFVAQPTTLAGSLYDERLPRISRSNGAGDAATQTWLVAYERRVATNANIASRLWGALITKSGALQPVLGQSTWQISTHETNVRRGFDVSSPTLPANGVRAFLLVEARDDAASASSDIYGTLLTHQGAGGTPTNLIEAVGFSTYYRGREQSSPVVDSDGCRFAVAYVHDFAAGDDDIHACTFAPAGLALMLAEAPVQLANQLTTESQPAICSRLSGRGHGSEYGFALREQPTGSYRIVRGIYDGRTDGTTFARRSTGCGGLDLDFGGTPALGSRLWLELPNAPALCGFVIGLPYATAIPLCGSCALGTSILVAMSGDALALEVPCQLELVGGTVSFQGYGVGGASTCLGPIALSDTIDVTVR